MAEKGPQIGFHQECLHLGEGLDPTHRFEAGARVLAPSANGQFCLWATITDGVFARRTSQKEHGLTIFSACGNLHLYNDHFWWTLPAGIRFASCTRGYCIRKIH